MWKALRREGDDVGRGHVERLMAANGICGAKRRGKPWRTTIAGSDPLRVTGPGQPRLHRDRADRTWVADFTYLRSWEGVVFFSFVLDVFSPARCVGWQFAAHMRTELVLDALQMALARPPRRPRRCARASLRPRLATRTQPVVATPGYR